MYPKIVMNIDIRSEEHKRKEISKYISSLYQEGKFTQAFSLDSKKEVFFEWLAEYSSDFIEILNESRIDQKAFENLKKAVHPIVVLKKKRSNNIMFIKQERYMSVTMQTNGYIIEEDILISGDEYERVFNYLSAYELYEGYVNNLEFRNKYLDKLKNERFVHFAYLNNSNIKFIINDYFSEREDSNIDDSVMQFLLFDKPELIELALSLVSDERINKIFNSKIISKYYEKYKEKKMQLPSIERQAVKDIFNKLLDQEKNEEALKHQRIKDRVSKYRSKE